MSMSSTQGPAVWTESLSAPEWEVRVACEVRHQARIEAAFDRVHACERIGDLEGALEALDKAGLQAGGVPPAYLARRALLALALRRRGQ